MRNIDFEEKRKFYTEKPVHDNDWMKSRIKHKRIGFGALCEYIGEREINDDYQSACAYVHGQDVITKMNPFTFYSSIYNRLYMMINYIFKAILLFDIEEDMGKEMVMLFDELLELGEEYMN